MPLERPDLERQLQRAQEALTAWVQVLDEKGIAPEARRRDPKWRSLNSKCTQLKSRLQSVAEIEKLNEESHRRKEEKASAGGEAEAPQKEKQKEKSSKKSKKKQEA